MMNSITEEKKENQLNYDFYLKTIHEAIREETKNHLTYLNKIIVEKQENKDYLQRLSSFEVILKKSHEEIRLEDVISKELEKVENVLRDAIEVRESYFEAIKKTMGRLKKTIGYLNEEINANH